MRKYNKAVITSAFSEISRLSREKKPVSLVKLPGLNPQSRTILKEVLTHSFNYRAHGFHLDKIFNVNGHMWTRIENTPHNPKDETLIDLIIRAMTYVNCSKKENREIKKSQFLTNQSTLATDEELITEIKKRGYLVYKAL